MTYEEFCEYVQTRCIYDAIYEDSEGRYILVITMPRAFSMTQHVSRNKLDTAPTQRKPLTDEEIDAIALGLWDSVFLIPDGFHQCARAIERAHGIGEKE